MGFLEDFRKGRDSALADGGGTPGNAVDNWWSRLSTAKQVGAIAVVLVALVLAVSALSGGDGEEAEFAGAPSKVEEAVLDQAQVMYGYQDLVAADCGEKSGFTPAGDLYPCSLIAADGFVTEYEEWVFVDDYAGPRAYLP